jgi:hypothetical protein
MNQSLAESLYVLVNSSHWQAFMTYKQARLEDLHRELEWQSGEGIAKAQGRIVEVRADLDLHRRLEEFVMNANA